MTVIGRNTGETFDQRYARTDFGTDLRFSVVNREKIETDFHFFGCEFDFSATEKKLKIGCDRL